MIKDRDMEARDTHHFLDFVVVATILSIKRQSSMVASKFTSMFPSLLVRCV